MSEKKEDTFELSNLFTKERIENGVWFEPRNNDIYLGIRFKVIGVGNFKLLESYAKYSADIKSISFSDGIEKALEKSEEITADFASKLIVDVETSDGKKIVINGAEIDNIQETMKILFLNNNAIADMIINFASNDFNFTV